MNIFVSHPEPSVSAAALDDRRVIKMILESAQLMTTAMIQLECGIETYDCTDLKWDYVLDADGERTGAQCIVKYTPGKVRYFAGTNVMAYKPTHVNHPCAIWTRTSYGNFFWLLNHFWALCDEYTSRYGREHYCERFSKFFANFLFEQYTFSHTERTPFANCSGFDGSDIYANYRRCLAYKWAAASEKYKPRWHRNSYGGPVWRYDLSLVV